LQGRHLSLHLLTLPRPPEGPGQEERAAKYQAYISRYLPQPGGEPGGRRQPARERCEQRREEVKRRLGGGADLVKKPVKVDRPEPAVKRNHRLELERHLGGPAPYKLATMGSARRLAYMASVVVAGRQYKTYPATFPSQQEAEEALAAAVLEQLGLAGEQEGGNEQEEPAVTSDVLCYAERVLQLLGKYYFTQRLDKHVLSSCLVMKHAR
jgi:hypothetical protein